MSAAKKLEEALAIVKALGLPRAQHNERSALCLLALCDMTPEKKWSQAESPYIDITPRFLEAAFFILWRLAPAFFTGYTLSRWIQSVRKSAVG